MNQMEAVRIKRTLAWPPGVKLSWEKVYHLTLLETNDKRAASRAAANYAAELLRRGENTD